MKLNKTLKGMIFAGAIGAGIMGCGSNEPTVLDSPYNLEGKIAEVPLPGYKGAMGLAAADFDNDGYVDLATVKNYGKDKGDVTLYLNNGSGEFIKY